MISPYAMDRPLRDVNPLMLGRPSNAGPLEVDLSERFIFENYIGGSWCRPATGNYLRQSSVSAHGSLPGNRLPGCKVARADARDIGRACAAAQEAAADWVRRGRAVRRAELGRLPGIVAAQGLALAMAEGWDLGLASPRLDLQCARYRAEALRELVRSLPSSVARYRGADIKPCVNGVIITADASQEHLCQELLPLLYDGRTLVVLLLYRDARQLPVTLLQLLGIIAAALPVGVLNVLTGLGLEAGVALIRQRIQQRRSDIRLQIHQRLSTDGLPTDTAVIHSPDDSLGDKRCRLNQSIPT